MLGAATEKAGVSCFSIDLRKESYSMVDDMSFLGMFDRFRRLAMYRLVWFCNPWFVIRVYDFRFYAIFN